jgi:hypothetical protein
MSCQLVLSAPALHVLSASRHPVRIAGRRDGPSVRASLMLTGYGGRQCRPCSAHCLSFQPAQQCVSIQPSAQQCVSIQPCVSDIHLHARCTSFYPSLSPRIACPVSSTDGSTLTTLCMSCQPRRVRADDAVHVLSAVSFVLSASKSLTPRSHRICQPVHVLSAHCMSCQRIPRYPHALHVLSATHCMSCQLRIACPVSSHIESVSPCMSSQPLSPRIACPVSSALPVLSALLSLVIPTHCLSCQLRTACPVSSQPRRASPFASSEVHNHVGIAFPEFF